MIDSYAIGIGARQLSIPLHGSSAEGFGVEDVAFGEIAFFVLERGEAFEPARADGLRGRPFPVVSGPGLITLFVICKSRSSRRLSFSSLATFACSASICLPCPVG